MAEQYKIESTNSNFNVKDIVDKIKLGYELQELDMEELGRGDILKYNHAIILAPDYQREYRSSVTDESSLIESVLLGIPIPPIFLASHKLKGAQVLNVVDGQHRLRAFYRFLTNQFKLKNLEILSNFNELTFEDFNEEALLSLVSNELTAITFKNFPGKDFELEVFNRYNKGTKPLTPQEIRHAVFGSRVNDMINDFCRKLVNDPTSSLAKAYSVSKDRFQKKTCQENIFVMLSILEHGIDQKFPSEDGNGKKLMKSPQYAEVYMQSKAKIEENEDIAKIDFEKTCNLFSKFNNFITALTHKTEHPFSREIYGVSQRGYKFQVSISMILAAIFKKMNDENYNFDQLNLPEHLEQISQEISRVINNSHLEDPEYKASSTNPEELLKVINDFMVPNY